MNFFWKCPFAGCNMVLPESMNLRYVKKERLPIYNKKLAYAYAETNKSVRWCPAPDCIYGVEVTSMGARPITCACGFVYCFKCSKEDHRPCDCEKVMYWLEKDEQGGALGQWLMLNTKPCPKCKKNIEKNQGCNYMQCRHPGCIYEFCWLCFAPMPGHSHQGPCNKFPTSGVNIE